MREGVARGRQPAADWLASTSGRLSPHFMVATPRPAGHQTSTPHLAAAAPSQLGLGRFVRLSVRLPVCHLACRARVPPLPGDTRSQVGAALWDDLSRAAGTAQACPGCWPRGCWPRGCWPRSACVPAPALPALAPLLLHPRGRPLRSGSLLAVDYVAMTPEGRVFDSSLEKGYPYQIRVGAGQARAPCAPPARAGPARPAHASLACRRTRPARSSTLERQAGGAPPPRTR